MQIAANWRSLALMTLGFWAAAVILNGSTASAAGSYELDPVLSLTGSCGTGSLDPIADPGCPEGQHPPLGAFGNPKSVTTDFYGDIYVVSYGHEEGKDGRIDIFNPEGFFIAEVPDSAGPKSVAVDSEGNMYVFEHRAGLDRQLRRFPPSIYEPQAGNIAYAEAPVVVTESIGAAFAGLSINRSNDHLFLHHADSVIEFGSALEGNKVIDNSIGAGTFGVNSFGLSVAVDASHNRIYATDYDPKTVIRVFNLKPPHELLQTINGSETPAGKLTEPSVAVDEDTGDVFIYVSESAKAFVYRFNEAGEYLETIEHGFSYVYGAQIGVDNGIFSPNRGYLFVPSHEGGTGHLFAFGPPPPVCPPEIESISFGEVTQNDAELRATINPCGLETGYAFEYTSQASFEKEGFAGAESVGGGQIPSGKNGVEVSALIASLDPDTSYRFRVVATNSEGVREEEDGFTTYLAPEPQDPSCPNNELRSGYSTLLPDCRAYELVTPPDTNGRTPRGVDHTGFLYFPTFEASPAGSEVSFLTEGGSLPGTEATGSLVGDPYLATRGKEGWSTAIAGPSGGESENPVPGSTSADQRFSFWESSGRGSASASGNSFYIRYPDGRSELIGQGGLGSDTRAEGKFITENGSHVIFRTQNSSGHVPIQLEPAAPPDGTTAIYDRTPDEVTHVVSLLPGGVTPGAGEDASYQGASRDGEGIAFTIGSTLYLRHEDKETYEVAEGASFAGVSEVGGRVFYVKGGNLFVFDTQSEETIPFTESGDVTVVNIAIGGTTAYFASPSVLTGEENPAGDIPRAGKENLYRSHEGTISFVGTLSDRDVEGEFGGNEQVDGLGLWLTAVQSGRLSEDPSRSVPNGDVLLFESRANLTGYDPEGHAEVYRYDAAAGDLQCLSCNPTNAPATGNASLQSVAQGKDKPEPFSSFGMVANLRPDGKRAFFQSDEALVVGDTDSLQDVYEWEAKGVGSCERSGGCVYLISSGHSDQIDYLYAVSSNGDDIFFRSADLLLPADADRTPSIYDARVGGGFSEEEASCPIDLDCREEGPAPPSLSLPSTGAIGPSGNVKVTKRCPKGKRRVTRAGKVRCVKRHHSVRRAGTDKKGGHK